MNTLIFLRSCPVFRSYYTMSICTKYLNYINSLTYKYQTNPVLRSPLYKAYLHIDIFEKNTHIDQVKINHDNSGALRIRFSISILFPPLKESLSAELSGDSPRRGEATESSTGRLSGSGGNSFEMLNLIRKAPELFLNFLRNCPVFRSHYTMSICTLMNFKKIKQ